MVLHCKVLSSPRELREPCLNPPSPFCHGGMWLITVTIVIKLLLPGRAKTMFYNVSFAASLNFLVWSGLCFNWLSAVKHLLDDNRMWQYIFWYVKFKNLRAFDDWKREALLLIALPRSLPSLITHLTALAIYQTSIQSTIFAKWPYWVYMRRSDNRLRHL